MSAQARYELQSRYMDASDVAACIVVEPSSLLRAARGGNGPRPYGKVAGRLYWLRDSVERWVEENEALIDRRRNGRAGAPRQAHAQPTALELELVSAAAACHEYSSGAEEFLRQPGFPAPVLILRAPARASTFYRRRDVEAFVAGETVTGEENSLRRELLTIDDLIGRLGLKRNTLVRLREKISLPARAARLGVYDVWNVADVERWVAAGGLARARACE